jgi:mono/diheme cytochrome c family protein
MRGIVERLRHPFWGSLAFLVASYLLIEYGIPYLPPLVGVESAPVPDSVVFQYFVSVLLGILLYVSSDEERWRQFREPPHRLLADPEKGTLRIVTLVAAMAVVGWTTYSAVRPSYGAPASLRSVHPAPPDQIQFRGETMRLSEMENPLREEGELEEHVRRGARVYVENCVPCHGDRLDGQGHFAPAFNPTPIDLTSGGNLPQLSESFVFWRIAKGGPGLPSEGTPWNSAMPAWEDVLTEREIWSVIVYLYERTGFTPREMEGGHGEGGGEGGETALRPPGDAEAGLRPPGGAVGDGGTVVARAGGQP